MLTARHPFRQQVWTNDDILPSNIPAFPHSLALGGYHPKLVGRLHALGPDQYHGYAERRIGDHSPSWPGKPRTGMGVLGKTTSPSPESISLSGAGKSVYEILDYDTTAAAIQTLHEIKDGSQDDPFFLTVGFMLPHPPYVADQEDYDLFVDRVPEPNLETPDPAVDHPFLKKWRKNRSLDQVDPNSARRARIAYYALTHRLDQMIGRILDTLEALDLDENTLIIYSSDHGDQIGERGLWWKHTFYDQSVKVPLILSWPGVLPKNERRQQLVGLQDVTATMLEAAGCEPLTNSDGQSFFNIALDPMASWDNQVFSEYCMDQSPEWTLNETILQRMVRIDDLKLVLYHGYPCQLFNLRDDPDELVDLADDPAYAETIESMRLKVLNGWDPEAIAKIIKSRAADMDLLKSWAAKVEPEDPIRWNFNPNQNQLYRPMRATS